MGLRVGGYVEMGSGEGDGGIAGEGAWEFPYSYCGDAGLIKVRYTGKEASSPLKLLGTGTGGQRGSLDSVGIQAFGDGEGTGKAVGRRSG